MPGRPALIAAASEKARWKTLGLLAGLAEEIDAAMAGAVKGLRGRGYSWAEIGTRFGISRQAAQQRWG